MAFELTIQHAFRDFTINASVQGDTGITAIFGPSGAGKTTLLRALIGTLQPDTGFARLNDRLLFDRAKSIHVPIHKRRIGTVFQDGRLFPHLSVQQNIRFSARYSDKQAAPIHEHDVIALLELAPLLDRMPAALSGGEAQRVALARALMSAPEMLVMDEPLAALDGPRKDHIIPFFNRLKTRTRIPIVYVTHSVDELAHLADTVVLLNDGQVVQSGRVFDVLSAPEAMPFIGVREAGSVITATVAETGQRGLTRLDTKAGPLELPGVHAQPGDRVRLRVLAQDVILARHEPTGLSARNILSARIKNLHRGRGPGVAVVLDVGDQTLLARITDASREDLELEIGQTVYAIIKASSVARPI